MKIEVVSLIYKSENYLRHIVSEFNSGRHNVDNAEISFRIIANDPGFLITECMTDGIPVSTYNDPEPDAHYLSRVYAAYNYGGMSSKADLICFVNSDMVFSNNWLNNLVKAYRADPYTIPCSVLVESGKMPSASCLKPVNFGQTLDQLNINGFLDYANKVVNQYTDSVIEGGLFMPCLLPKYLFDRRDKRQLMYPFGNLYSTGFGTFDGDLVQSGDAYYFDMLNRYRGLKHITVLDSVVYHICEGEKDARS